MKFEAEILQFRTRLSKYDSALGRISTMIRTPGGRYWPESYRLSKTSDVNDFLRTGEVIGKLMAFSLPRLEEGRARVAGQIVTALDLKLEKVKRLVEEGYLPSWSLQILDRERLAARFTKRTSDVSESDEPNKIRRFELPNKRIIEVRDGINYVVLTNLLPTYGGNALPRKDFLSRVLTELALPISDVSKTSVTASAHEIDERLRPMGYEILKKRDFMSLDPKEICYEMADYDSTRVFKSVDDLKEALGDDPRITKFVDDNHIFRNLRTILRERSDLWPTKLVQNGFRWDEPSFRRLVAFFRDELIVASDSKDRVSVRTTARNARGPKAAGKTGQRKDGGADTNSRTRRKKLEVEPETSQRETFTGAIPPDAKASPSYLCPQQSEASCATVIFPRLNNEDLVLLNLGKNEIISDLTLRILSKLRLAENIEIPSVINLIKGTCGTRISMEKLIGETQMGEKMVLKETPEAFLVRVVLTEISQVLIKENPGNIERRIQESFRVLQSKWSLPKIADYLCKNLGLPREDFDRYIGKVPESDLESRQGNHADAEFVIYANY